MAHLEGRGMRILDRGWRITSGGLRGELDVVAVDGRTLVVVEVKTRRGDRYGGPLVAVTPDKQRRIRALAAAYLRERRPRTTSVRFDVVAVWLRPTGTELRHVRSAF